MKKQQIAGKKLSRSQMKDVKGGAASATTGVWVCPPDYYDCYFTKGECLTYCSIPSRCRLYGGCP